MAFLKAAFDVGNVKKVTYTYREYTQKGADLFEEKLGETDWENVYMAEEVEKKAEALQEKQDSLMN